ncbi:ATP:guanido phosphotransferase, N-terminal [Pseudocohnilembus persalinus]|uniref:ATP:guanido phosphotransferase, N-terminal n=1 Tax=Pseudocohnilembus persalinus TaxID=266149 RepID=A0A0V0QUI6_PSEPJ|nr:ATP:guanido phosphotransferase, N-terminal [Pseudocohnilembus persalinus]|eukprot:KRX06012.1 ATP:guanido phosphotransferase, N-terminal [Pseudocohnilembus persalinus]
MDKDFKELTENQQKFKNFVEANKLEEILMDMLHTMSHNIIQNPIIFMIQYLSSYLTQEELLKYGINIQNHKFTPQKQNGDCLVKQQNSEPLPNQGNQNSGKSSSKKKQKKKKQLEKIVEEQVNEQQMQNIDSSSINIQQNQKISKKLLINLPDINELKNKNNLFFHCFYSKEKQSFTACKDKQTELNNTIRPIIKAAIQNQDKYDCIYACDFDAYQSFQPIFHDFIQESIGYNEQNQILALINKDDHLELLFQNIQNQNNYNPIDKICKIFKYSQNIDSKLFVNFAFDSNYGYITVKPKYMGLGLSMKSIIEIPSDFLEQFQINLQRIPDFLTNLFQIKKVVTDSIQEFQGIYVYKLQSINCILETEETFIEKLDNLIQIIFDNFPQTQEKLLYYRNQNVNQIFDPIEIEEEESPSKDQYQSKEDHQQNELWEFIEKNSCVINENCYEVFENKIQSEFLNSNQNVDVNNNIQNIKQQPDHYVIQVDQEQGLEKQDQQKNEQNQNHFVLKNLIQQLEDQNDIILQSHNLIDNSIIIARRNISNMQFKPQMKQDDFNIINSIAQSYIKQQLVKNQNQGDWYKSTTKIYEEIQSKRYLLENRIFGDKMISEEVMEFESLNQQQQLTFSLIDCFGKDFQELVMYDYQQFIKYKNFYINQLQNMLQQDDEQEKIQIQNEVLEQIDQKQDQNELIKGEKQQQIEFDDSYVKKNMELKNVHQKQNQEILEQKKFRKFSQKLRPDDKLIWVNVNNINEKLNAKIKMELHRNLEGFNFPQFCGLTELNELYIKIIQGLFNRDNFNLQNNKDLQDRYTDLFSFNLVNDLSQVPNRLLPKKLKISKNSLRMDEKFKENNYLQYNLQHSSLKFYKETNDQLNVVKNQGKEQNQQLNLQNLEQQGKNQYCILNKQQNLAIWLGHDNTHIIIVLKVQIEDQYIIDELNQILNKILTIAQQDQYLYDKDFGYIQNLCANDGIKLNLNISFPQNMIRNIENICQSQGFQLNIKYDTQEGNAYRSNISVEKNKANKYQWSQQSSGIQNILQLVNLKLN